IQGNFIGTDKTGTVKLGNGLVGVFMGESAASNTIGGTAPGAGNVISGNNGQGVYFLNSASKNLLEGNFIGTDLSGTANIGNTTQGVFITNSANSNTIGAIATGAGNTIAFNPAGGVVIDAPTNDGIRGNSIFVNNANNGQGITLFPGANNNQAAPTLSNVVFAGGVTTLTGTSTPNALLDFFASRAPDTSTTAEGQQFLGSGTADGTGNFNITLNVQPLGSVFTATATDPTTNNTSMFSVPFNANTTLTVTNSATPNPVTAGQTLSYTITVANTGASDAINATLAEATPQNTTFQSVTTPSGWTATTPQVGGQGGITFTNPDVATGSSATFTIVVNVKSSTPSTASSGKTLDNTATITWGNPTGSTATASQSVTVNAAPSGGLNSGQPTADLAITNSALPNPVAAGNDIIYTFSVSNSGPNAASNLTVANAVPNNTTFQSTGAPAGWTVMAPAVGGTGNVTFTNPTLANGANATFTMTVQVSPTTAAGSTISDTASVTASTNDPTPANDSATQTVSVTSASTASADLAVTQTAAPSPVAPGANLTYTITVTNNGPNGANSVNLSMTTPANTTFQSATTPTGWTATTPTAGGTGSIAFANPTLANGASATFMVVVQVATTAASGSAISNTATVANSTNDPITANNSSTISTPVAAPTGQIAGAVFQDANANGTQDQGEVGLPGRTVFIDTNNNGVLDSGETSTTTDNNGNYSFTGIAPGTFTVREAPQIGDLASGPNGGALSVTVTAGSTSAGNNIGVILISSATPISAVTAPFPQLVSDNTAYVSAIYGTLLGRAPDTGGLGYWVNALQNGLTNRASVAASFWMSPEHRGLEVDSYFQNYLGHTADAGGRAFWVNQFLAGASEIDVAAAFLNSPEFIQGHAGNTAFVTALYQDILGHAPDSAGLAFWTNALSSGGISTAQVVRSILQSPESLTRLVDGFYSAFLHRPADTAGQAFWVGQLEAGLSPTVVVESILGSPELGGGPPSSAASSTTPPSESGTVRTQP
ncbi:MAG: DUF4214 domain-containing protein, partial [Terriglobales bacterium]